MAVTLEQVEKLREKADVSYEEAKDTLKQADGDLLEALIVLERLGRTKSSKGSGNFFTTQTGAGAEIPHAAKVTPPFRGTSHHAAGDRPGFWAQLRELLRAAGNILRHSTANQFEVWRNGQMMTSIPVLILIILCIVAFWISIPLIIGGLFFGCRYRFSGPDLGKETINHAMGTVSETVDGMVNEMKREFDKRKK